MLAGAGTSFSRPARPHPARADAAGDPEIWGDPSRVIIFGSGKKIDPHTYDIAGLVTGFIPDGRLNNIDLRGGLATGRGRRL